MNKRGDKEMRNGFTPFFRNVGTIFKTKKLRHRLYTMWGITLIIATYLILWLCYTMAAVDFSLNPIKHISYLASHGGIPIALIIVGFIVLACIVLFRVANDLSALRLDDRNFLVSDSGIYGTADFATEEELSDVALVQPVEDCNGTILGQLDETGTKVINMKNDSPDLRINRHVLIFGASQSGKTYCYAKPFCYQAAKRRESLIVTDPKGELYEDTAEYFRKKGYIIRRFDIKTPEFSDGWDCLSEIRADDTRAQIFADCVIKNTGDLRGAGGDPVFEDGPKALLQAVLLYVAKSPLYGTAEKPRSFASAFELVKDAGDMGESGLDNLFSAPSCPQEARDAYNLFKNASVNLRGNLITGLGTRLQVLANKTIKEITSENDIDLTLPGKRPCVYYCIMSDQQSTFNFLSALFFSFLFIDLVEYADAQKNRRCQVPVNFLLDEFANIGSIPDFEKKIATIRSRALNVSIICQDINQLRNRYPYTFPSIMSNCATHLCIGFNDLDTQRYYAERSGEMTVKTMTEQHPVKDPLLGGLPHSTGDGRRNILTSDELARLGVNECLIVFQAHNVVKAYKFAHTLHPESKLTRHISANNAPSIFDKERRAAIRVLEQERVRRFDDWHSRGCPEGEEPEVIPLESLEDGTVTPADYVEDIGEFDMVSFEQVVPASTPPSLEKESSSKPAERNTTPNLPGTGNYTTVDPNTGEIKQSTSKSPAEKRSRAMDAILAQTGQSQKRQASKKIKNEFGES